MNPDLYDHDHEDVGDPDHVRDLDHLAHIDPVVVQMPEGAELPSAHAWAFRNKTARALQTHVACGLEGAHRSKVHGHGAERHARPEVRFRSCVFSTNGLEHFKAFGALPDLDLNNKPADADARRRPPNLCYVAAELLSHRILLRALYAMHAGLGGNAVHGNGG